ncbi:MAG: hypothetical protein KAX44_05440 [Candidatus Brocadiae bacterium]|nr:hypothetical protein [Candidatus Brocadiia bacterium]
MDPNGACSFSANNRVLFRVPDPATSAQVSAFFISGLGEGETVADVIEIWFATCAILASYIEPSHQAEFMGWLQEGFESFELTKVTGLRSQERWFGSRALRVEHRYSEFLGYTISVELNDRFPPLHDLNGGETAKSWADMRLGLTLEEVEAFAGPGRLQSSMGESRQYHFGEGYALGWVTFINGRAETWMAP